MQKSLELMQRRNRRLLEINAEQVRAISKLYIMLGALLTEWDLPHTKSWRTGYNSRVAKARELIKELKL